MNILMAMAMMAGQQVSLTDTSQSHTAVSPNTASATLRIVAGLDNEVQGLAGATVVPKYVWLLSGSASDYEFRATALSGTTPAGTFGSWNDAGTADCSWALNRSTDGVSTGEITIECRRKSDSAVIATCVFTFTATRSP